MKGDHRDRMLEQALTHELRPTGSAPTTDACLDAETLSAWMDGGLDPASLAAAEAHASNCERCQALIATVVRTIPLAPGTEARGTLFLWRWWLAPLAAGAAAVTLWMVVPQEPVQPPLEPVPATATVARDAAQTPPPAEPPQTPPANQARRNAPGGDAREKLAESRRSDADPLAAAPNRDRLEARKEDAGAREAMLGRAAAAPPAAVAVAPPASAEVQAQMRQAFTLEVVSPDQSRRWRVLEGTLQRSTDGGRTWTAVRTLADEQLTAGASPSPNVCWFVGRAGVVLVSSDGVTFLRATAPAAIDLTSVTAVDGRTATVTAADGRAFRTDDGGVTWRP